MKPSRFNSNLPPSQPLLPPRPEVASVAELLHMPLLKPSRPRLKPRHKPKHKFNSPHLLSLFRHLSNNLSRSRHPSNSPPLLRRQFPSLRLLLRLPFRRNLLPLSITRLRPRVGQQRRVAQTRLGHPRRSFALSRCEMLARVGPRLQR